MSLRKMSQKETLKINFTYRANIFLIFSWAMTGLQQRLFWLSGLYFNLLVCIFPHFVCIKVNHNGTKKLLIHKVSWCKGPQNRNIQIHLPCDNFLCESFAFRIFFSIKFLWRLSWVFVYKYSSFAPPPPDVKQFCQTA